MPQLDFQWFYSQVFWLTATFALLYLILAWRTLPHIGKVIENRNEKIGAELSRAESLRKEAEALERQYMLELERAHATANKAMAEATTASIADANHQHHEVDKAIAKKLSEAEKKIRESKTKALNELKEQQVEITKLILKKVSGLNIDDGKIKNAIEQAAKQYN